MSGLSIIGHLDKTKTARLTRHLIPNQSHVRRRNTGLCEPIAQILLSRLKR
jgi:hypothetical protein